ncbi:hypothetical protein [Serratia silvae]|uniref:Uncharacterized protein n=1 Tax=Serratia silvae TaxID=2824122 RepID=A0ABT0KAK3_9GAMM|nr:hypothetical protein [Serratia silvae]MCL1028774.1 hypothetical protein [Serratia silvae]
MRAVLTGLILGSAVIVSGCQMDKFTENRGRLVTGVTWSCSGSAAPEGEIMPPQWYDNMIQCASQNNFKAAAMSYLFAGTYSWYDARMLDTHYARNLHSALPERSLVKLTYAQQTKLRSALGDLMGSNDSKQEICRVIAKAGSPRYQPDYMMKNSISLTRLGADKEARFSEALRNYLHCT